MESLVEDILELGRACGSVTSDSRPWRREDILVEDILKVGRAQRRICISDIELVEDILELGRPAAAVTLHSRSWHREVWERTAGIWAEPCAMVTLASCFWHRENWQDLLGLNQASGWDPISRYKIVMIL